MVINKRKLAINYTNNQKEPENYDIGFDYFKLTSQIGTKMQYAISDLKDELDMIES